MGPGDNQINADSAVDEILSILKNKYGIRYDKLCHPNLFQEDVSINLKLLRDAVRELFKIDCQDSW